MHYSLIDIYQIESPQRDALYSTRNIRGLEVRGPHTWEVVKDAAKNIRIRGELFDIPLECHDRHACPIMLKYFKNVDATPFVYDQFIGA